MNNDNICINQDLLTAMALSGWRVIDSIKASDGSFVSIYRYNNGQDVRHLGYNTFTDTWYSVTMISDVGSIAPCSTRFALARATGSIDNLAAKNLKARLELKPKAGLNFRLNVSRNTLRKVGRAVAAGVVIGLSINYVRSLAR